jgi:hypothetical protein
MCLADETTPSERIVKRIVLDLSEEARPWARSENLLLLEDVVCDHTPADFETDDPQLFFVSPDANTKFRLSPGQPIETQRIPIEVGSSRELQQVILWLDENILATFTEPPYHIWWPLEVGEHDLWAEGLTQSGDSIFSDTVHFEVEPAEE